MGFLYTVAGAGIGFWFNVAIRYEQIRRFNFTARLLTPLHPGNVKSFMDIPLCKYFCVPQNFLDFLSLTRLTSPVRIGFVDMGSLIWGCQNGFVKTGSLKWVR